MATLTVYPDKLDLTRSETHTLSGSLADFLDSQVPGWSVYSHQPISAWRNGSLFAPARWRESLSANDQINLVCEPGEATTAMWVVMAISTAMSVYAMSNIPDNYQQTKPKGSSIHAANAQGNEPALMGIVPQIAGTHRIYPWPLMQPHRMYEDHQQRLLMLMAIGDGDFEYNAEQILISNTPVDRYDGQISYEIFEAGQDVSGHTAHRNIYNSREVEDQEIEALTERWVALDGLGRFVNLGWWSDRYRFTMFDNSDAADGLFEVGDTVEINGLNNDIILLSAAVDIQNGQIEALSGLNVAAVGDKVQLVGTEANQGCYLIAEISETHIALIDLAGNPVSLIDDYQCSIHLLADHAWLGAFVITAVAMDHRYTVERLGEPDWGGWDDVAYVDTYVQRVNEVAPHTLGPFLACPASEVVDNLELDFRFPKGLNTRVDITIRYREVGTSNWTEIEHYFEDDTHDERGYTINPGNLPALQLPRKMLVEVEVERTTNSIDDASSRDQINWVYLKSELETVTSYPWPVIAFDIYGDNTLAASSENQIAMHPTRKLQIPDGLGGWTADKHPTNDIAPFLRYAMLDAGLTDEQIDQDELLRLHAIWQSRGDEFNGVFDEETVLWDAIKRILAPGMAEPTLDWGQLVPIREELQETFEQVYLPHVYRDNAPLTRSTSLINDDEPDGIEVEYIDPVSWKPATVLCTLPGDAALEPKKERLFGCTSKTQAWRWGMRLRRRQRYERHNYSFGTELDAMNSSYRGYVALADDRRCTCGEVVSVEGVTLTLDACPGDWPESPMIAIRRPDGSMFGPVTPKQGETPEQIIVPALLDFEVATDGSQEPPYFIFGDQDHWLHAVRVSRLTTNGLESVNVEAVNYDARVYEDDDGVPV